MFPILRQWLQNSKSELHSGAEPRPAELTVCLIGIREVWLSAIAFGGLVSISVGSVLSVGSGLLLTRT